MKPQVRTTAGVKAEDDGWGSVNSGPTLPRLLVIDSTRVSGQTATGQLKGNFLTGWRDDAFLQVAAHGDRYLVARSIDDPSTDEILSVEDEVLREIGSFEPRIVYYRPTMDQHAQLHALALTVLERHPIPLITHIMDDWPRRLEARDEARARVVNRDLRQLLLQSDKVLSISEKMSAVLGDRYGVTFEAIANGVDPDTFRVARAAAKPVKSGRKEVVLRYCGALAQDMTFQTLVDVAHAVDALQSELSLRLEVYTMPVWRRAFEEAVAGLRGTTISNAVFGDGFPTLLAEADVVVLPYNFDEVSLRYIGLSIPNKLPEYLASGAALLAVGPREANGIEYVLSNDLGCCVTERDPAEIAEALRRLGTDSDYRGELAGKAEAWASVHLDLARVSERFQTILRETAERSGKRVPILGPYSRDRMATVDEAEVIATLLAPLERDGVLLDVGAHYGNSLKPFAEADWKVLACEPDSENRARLVDRFGSMSNVSVDPRAVSNEPAREVALFSSAQSPAISSLHAFHETHQETETVDVTTVAELVDSYALSRIDFLKIDVEGLDWKVLKGVPWDHVTPEVIQCEFEDAKTLTLGHTYRDMADDLVARGYTVYVSEWHPIARYGVPHEWRQLVQYPIPLSSSDAWGNFLAFQEDPGAERVRTAFAACLGIGDSARVRSERQEGTTPASVSAGSGGGVGYDARAVTPTGLSRYERLYLWAKARNPAVFSIARLVAWAVRKARRYPILMLAYLALLAGLVVAGFLPALSSLDSLFWLIAAALVAVGVVGVVMGFTNFLIKEARHELEMQQLSLRRRLERTERSLRSGEKLEGKVDELLSAQRSTKDALLAEIDRLNREHKAGNDALVTSMNELRTNQREIAEHELSVDIVSALRQIHPLWTNRERVDGSDFADPSEHGHAILMALLVEEEQEHPGILRGKTLIEVGSTRERDPRQGSTEKLAIFTAMTDMRFTTVDMDPVNTGRARRVIDLLNPGAKAITDKGEDYLAKGSESLDYVYLDAFDFDHGQHSDERQARYREVLQTEIRDEACWQMHQLCAAAIVSRMPEGGIVVVDDTWTDESGNFDGKGKLAVPLLLASGFTVITQTPETVALKRAASTDA